MAVNAFAWLEDFDASPTLPCVSIPITAAIRAADAALQAERERLSVSPAQEWRDRVQLNPANLRTVRPAQPAAGRVIEWRQYVASGERAKRYCTACKAELNPCVKGALCSTCRPTAKTTRTMRLCAAGCGRRMEARSTQQICKLCRPKAGKLKTCASCPRTFSKYSPHATCRECRRVAMPKGLPC
jgi:hypothetical protein